MQTHKEIKVVAIAEEFIIMNKCYRLLTANLQITLLSTLFSEISVKSNLLIHQSQANCSLVGCSKVFVIIWQIMQAVVELAKSRFIQRKCLCVFSRLWKLTSMSRNFLQNVYSQSIQNALKTQCSDINCSWMRWIRNRNQKPFVAFTFLGDCPLSDIALSDIAFQIWIWGGGISTLLHPVSLLSGWWPLQ